MKDKSGAPWDVNCGTQSCKDYGGMTYGSRPGHTESGHTHNWGTHNQNTYTWLGHTHSQDTYTYSWSTHIAGVHPPTARTDTQQGHTSGVILRRPTHSTELGQSCPLEEKKRLGSE